MMRLAILGFALSACMTGTETDVSVTTDVPCTSISNAIVSLSHPGDSPAAGAQTVLSCNGGSFGTAVYHPADDTATEVTVVAAASGSDPATCLGSTPAPTCIVVRHHAPVAYQTNVDVVLEAACTDLFCGPGLTCSHGVCVSSQ